MNGTKSKNKNLVYNVWNDLDPNDSFEVEASNSTEALYLALEQLGWVLGEGQEIEEDLEEKIN